MTAYGATRTLRGEIVCFRFCPIVLKKSLSAMFDFLGGLRARHSKISWGTSQFFDCAACEVLSGSEMVLNGNVPSDSNLASFRRARFFDFFNEIAP
jgi:hypothetical protein